MTALPFKVKALFEYSSAHEDDLKFPEGQIITVTEEEDDDWYCGEYVDVDGTKQEGLFPRNFVEKYEPTAPPRPTRTRTKKDVEPATSAPEHAISAQPPTEELSPLHTTEPDVNEAAAASPPGLSAEPVPPAAPIPTPAKPAEPLSPPTPVPPLSKQSEASPVTSPSAAKAVKPGGPPPVSEKPTSSSFKDRIAAFNKPAAAPVAPFKPSGLSGGVGFVKKPFVAPPPARNAYVPPPQSVPTAKVYRREEDPEIKEREAENLESAEKAGLVPTSSHDDGEDDQPKPTSLKERIALLQKQQMEAAGRHAEASAKKDKPKRPPKKRTESHEAGEGSAEPESGVAAGNEEEAGGKKSIDSARAPVPRRKSSSKPQESFGDGNDADMSGAGDTTEGQEDLTEGAESDERSRHPSHAPTRTEPPEEEEGEEEEDGEEDEDEDPEARRKEELRARMAKMSGGMGMHGMFGPPGMMPMPGAAPPKKKKPPPPERHSVDDGENARGAPPVPMMMALPGMSVPRRSEETEPAGRDESDRTTRAPPPPPAQPAEDDEEEDEELDAPRMPNLPSREPAGPPPIPGGRPAPPPIPTEVRSPPPPPPAAVKSPSAGSESDDELSERAQDLSLETPRADVPPGLRSPPPLPPSIPSPGLSSRPSFPTPTSQLPEDTSPISPASKRNSRPPPPIPGATPAIPPAQTRPPPPPPPTASLSRHSTADGRIMSPVRPSAHDDEEDEEVTEYEGDYDTDIASSVPHKDALKSHARESSFEESAPLRSPTSASPPSIPPPIPTGAPRAVPPPIPSQPPPDKRRSVDQPRAAPPPPPPQKETSHYDDDEYDPYNYSVPKQSISGPGGHSQKTPKIEEEAYFPETLLAHSTSHERRGVPMNRAAPSGQSFEFNKAASANRTSADAGAGRPSTESGFIANDLDLAKQSGWWRQSNQVPPVLQGRRDIYFESEESTSTNRGAKTIVTRTIYVLFRDYSQTVLTARFDPYEPSEVQLEQRHEPPPRALRQDQLEESYDRYGRQIAETVTSKKDSVVGDGSPQGLVHDLLRPFRDALSPVGTRAYGALVYSNMANSSTQQFDEIRAGDIISIRNAKFQGKHGAMHAKYSTEVGKPDHVAIVAEWDGTKKKVRAWEQGRESRKVKLESFKLDDLRSGEVRVWRVMPRSWVGWNTQP